MLCHKEVRRIARDIAGAAYEQMAHEDVFYKAYPDQNYFINRHWKSFIPDARRTLLQILAGNYAESMKEEALQIFLQDKTLQAVNDLETQGSA